MPLLKDCELIQLMQDGDPEALVLLYDRYSGLVYSVARRVLKNSASAEDITQELFMQLWNNPRQIQVLEDTVCGWMVVASRNRSISVLRKKCPEQLDENILASPCHLEKDMEQRLTCETLINHLREEQRVLLEMAFLREMTHTEIASATGYPLGTIKSRIRSALANLRRSLTQLPDTLLTAADPVLP